MLFHRAWTCLLLHFIFPIRVLPAGTSIRTMLALADLLGAEYVIFWKLEFMRLSGEEKHANDIRGMLRTSPDLIDQKLIEEGVRKMSLEKEWARVLEGL